MISHFVFICCSTGNFVSPGEEWPAGYIALELTVPRLKYGPGVLQKRSAMSVNRGALSRSVSVWVYMCVCVDGEENKQEGGGGVELREFLARVCQSVYECKCCCVRANINQP